MPSSVFAVFSVAKSTPARKGYSQGFTLIEVLIALVIAATALTLGFGAVRGSAQRLSRIEEATLAQWAIDNVVNDLQLQAANIKPGRHRYVETMLGREFVLEADVQRTEKPPVLTIDVRVTDKAAPGVELDSARVETLYANDEG